MTLGEPETALQLEIDTASSCAPQGWSRQRTSTSRGRGTRQGETRRGRASQIARSRDTRGFTENRRAAREGGTIAGHARKELEKKTGRKVVTSENYLALAPTAPKRKRLPRKKPKPD